MMQRMTISDLARAEGVDKALISRRVKSLGLKTLPGPRGAKFVNLADWNRVCGRRPDEVLKAPADLLDHLARRGKLGTTGEATTLVKAGRLYQVFYRRSAVGDSKAEERLRAIEQTLGVNSIDLCNLVLIEGRPLTEIKAEQRFLQMRLRECLGEIAKKLGLR
jgi:hypothetical protein